MSEDNKLLILELERKDNLLSMLTDGLREVEDDTIFDDSRLLKSYIWWWIDHLPAMPQVESSQERWLSDNNLLFQELEQAHDVNEELSHRIIVLEAELLKKVAE